MKKIDGILLLCIIIGLISCGFLDKAFRPSHFSMRYDGEVSGIENLIRIDGYYAHDTTLSVIFYKDGISCVLLHNAAPAKVRGEIYFDEPIYQDKLIWGLYRIANDTIEAQYVDRSCMSENKILHYSYKITEDKRLHILESSVYENWIFFLDYLDFTDPPRIPKSRQKDGGILSFYPYSDSNDFLTKNWILSHKWAWKPKARKQKIKYNK